MEAWILWIIIIIALVFIEVITINLVTIWFIASALLSLIVSFFSIAFTWQFGIFVLGGTLLMISTRPILKKWIPLEKVKTNSDRVIGMDGIVTEEILDHAVGEVKVDGKRWSAISSKKIAVGEKIIVDEIVGVKLKVNKSE